MNRHKANIYIDADSRPEKESFCVALLHVPAFPDEKPVVKAIEFLDGQLLAVVGCNDDTGLWGYVTLNDEEKNAIGGALQEAGSDVGRWYWCTLFDYRSKKT